MYSYTCYGLHVLSELEIPEFVPSHSVDASAKADVEVHFGGVDRPRPRPSLSGNYISVTPEETHFFWEYAGDYLIQQGRSIVISPMPGTEPEFVRLPLLGVVFGALLVQKGFQVLHASAVNVRGTVVGLVGNKGMGKSTTAATFHQAGYQAVTDDVLALRMSGDGIGFEMLPAFPHLKLWPQAVASLGEEPEDHPPLHSRVTKRSFMLHKTFPTEPLPMARLYLLGWGERTIIEEVSEAEAFRSLVPHTFASRFEPDTPSTMEKLLVSCSALVKGIPTKRLVRKADLNGLEEIVEAVEEDLCVAS
jgi:hypothetical protein